METKGIIEINLDFKTYKILYWEASSQDIVRNNKIVKTKIAFK